MGNATSNCGECPNCVRLADCADLIKMAKGRCDNTDLDYQQAKRDYPCTGKAKQ